MPRTSTQKPPKLSKHKATGRAYVTLDGRQHYLGKHGTAKSREAYGALVSQWMAGGGHYRPDSQQEITVAEVMAAYVAHARGYYRKNGKVTREYELVLECCKIIKPLFGRSPVVEFGPLALKSVRLAMIDMEHCRKHINKNVDRIKRMFKWAAAEELIPATVPQALSMVAGLRQGRTEAIDHPPVMPVDDDIVEATLKHMPEVPADMVRIQRLIGCRPSEVCQLRPCDLDRSGDVWLYKPESHKTEHHGKERTILIGPKAQGVLLRYLARDAKAYCFRPCDSESKRLAARSATRVSYLSCGNRPGTNRKAKPKRSAGDQYKTDAYRRAITRGCDKAFPAPKGMKGEELEAWRKDHRWAPNRLRHSAGTQVRREFGLEAAQVILGHSNANITQTYAERDMAKGAEVARRIG